ncbi:18K peptidoglycan-associated outer membrane lipoprotein [Minicystis rosea]|nr:18K peptidoglycan-associated outer membrane lipoprotein [Minicystis rosea]
MHARVASGVFLALGFADLALLNLLLAPRLAAERALADKASPQEISAPVEPPRAPAQAVTVVKPPSSPPPSSTATIAANAHAGQSEAAPDVLFSLESERITSFDAAMALDRVARELRADPKRRVLLRGHTDRLGTSSFNVVLSRRRAESVRHFLIAHGAPGERIDIESVGDTEPADPGDGFMAWAKNRRVQVIWR